MVHIKHKLFSPKYANVTYFLHTTKLEGDRQKWAYKFPPEKQINEMGTHSETQKIIEIKVTQKYNPNYSEYIKDRTTKFFFKDYNIL